jgi:signal transduction histidine kinase
MAKKDDPENIKTAYFHISAALFEELGERLVSKPEIALAELIKNSYDADASYCEVKIGVDEVVVSDDGHGLTEHEFLNNWMVVSSTNKVKRRHSRLYQRHMAGSKGVGRFSARFLGTVLIVESTTEDLETGTRTTLKATFDWIEISKNADVADVKIPYTVRAATRAEHVGTKLTMRKLREHVSDLPVSRVRTDVLRLVKADGGLEQPEFEFDTPEDTAEDPGFRVYFSDEEGDGAEMELAGQILNRYVARARMSVNIDGAVDFRVYWKGQKKPVERRSFRLDKIAKRYGAKALSEVGGDKDARGLPAELEGVPHLPLADSLNSPVFIDIRFFPNRQGTFVRLPVNGRRAMTWVKDNSGVAVVDNGFAMPAYADENSDWLAIESSKSVNERNWQSVITPMFYPMDPLAKKNPGLNPMLALPRVSQLIGRVHVATRKGAINSQTEDGWLMPNMDREQLRDNGAYRLMWHLVRFSVEALAHFDRAVRIQDEAAREEEARKKTRAALAATISEIRSSQEISFDHKRVMLRQLEEAEEQLTIAEGYDKNVRMSLELMSTMGVMAGFMTHEFEKTLEAIHRAGKTLQRLAKKHPEILDETRTILRNEEALAEQAEYMRLFIGASRRMTIDPFKARAQLTVVIRTVEALAKEHGIDIEIDANSKLAGPAVPLAAYHGVTVNLLSNAMKALVARSTTADRKIKIYATNDSARHILVCADNGIGIPEYMRDRVWDPLFTTTETADDANPLNSGLGLGLPVIKRVVEGVGGRVELMKTAPAGFNTAFRVSFPLARD